jgi:hypothetical protein
MKLRKALTLLTTAVILTTIVAPASAFSITDTFSQFVSTQKNPFADLSAEKIASYIQSNGILNLNSLLTDIGKRAYELVKNTDSAWVKTAGDQIADLNQERVEITHQGNTQSTAKSTKYFQDNVGKVQQIAGENEAPSDSSLEATNKQNKLASANLLTSQQLTKATLDLTLAQQTRNSIDIAAGQQAATDRLRDQINAGFAQNEFQRLQVVTRRRFYPNANGQMVEGNADASTRVFYGKK